MESRKVWQLLAGLNSTVRSDFLTHLSRQAPDTHALHLLEAIHHFIGRKKPPTETQIWALMDKKKSLNPRKVKQHASSLVSLLETYLVGKELERNAWQRAPMVMDLYLQQGWSENFSRAYKAQMGRLGAVPQTVESLYHRHHLELTYHNHHVDFDRKNLQYFEQAMETFDEYWSTQKLKYAAVHTASFLSLGRGYQPKKEWQDPLYDYILQRLDFETYPLASMYGNLFKLARWRISAMDKPLEGEMLVVMKETLARWMDQHKDWPVSEANLMLKLMLNFFNVAVNLGQAAGLGEDIQKCYEVLIQQQLRRPQDRLSWRIYRNVVIVLSRSGDHKRAFLFMDKWKEELDPAHREEVYRLCKATCYFRMNQLKKVLEHLKGEFGDLDMDVQARVLRWQTLFQLQPKPIADFQVLDDLHLLLKLLSRLILKIKRPEVYSLRLQYFEKLLVADQESSFQLLATELEAEEDFNGKNWILQQVRETINERAGL